MNLRALLAHTPLTRLDQSTQDRPDAHAASTRTARPAGRLRCAARPLVVLAVVTGSLAGGLGAAHVARADSMVWVQAVPGTLAPGQSTALTFLCPGGNVTGAFDQADEVVGIAELSYSQSDPSIYAYTLTGIGQQDLYVSIFNMSLFVSATYRISFVCQGGSSSPAGMVNDTDPSLIYSGSGWNYSSGRPSSFNDYAGDVHYTMNNGDNVIYTFSGTSVKFFSEQSKDEGLVEVYIDGQDRGALSEYSATRQNYGGVSWTFSNLPPGNHNILLVKKSGSYMLVDAFQAS